MMRWREYRQGDWESFSQNYLLPHLIPSTRTLIDHADVPWAILGLVCYAPGTFEVFLDVRGGRASYDVFKAIHAERARLEMAPWLRTVIAFVDPSTPSGVELAQAFGMKKKARFERWWNGEPRILMGREIR